MRHTHTARLETPASLRPFRILASVVFAHLFALLAPGTSPAQSLFTTDPHELLTSDPSQFATLLERVRPPAVTVEEKARILRTLPRDGEVTTLDRRARAKLSAVEDVLRAMKRDGVYEIKVVDVPHARTGAYARAVVLVSEPALGLVSADELRALVAHEIGHEYVWTAYEHATAVKDGKRIRQLELVCDAIAVVTLQRLGIDPSRLSSAVEKITRFNRERFGNANNEADYPTVEERRAFVRAVAAWAAADSLHAPQGRPGDAWPGVIIKDVYTRDAARRTLTAANKTLAKPACQSLLREFRDREGQPLVERLQPIATTPQEYLKLMYFFDGERTAACRKDGVLAFTEPGSRVVYLCGRDFERASRRDPRIVEATLIHEMLHSLGLGENPPAPRTITDRVLRLCW